MYLRTLNDNELVRYADGKELTPLEAELLSRLVEKIEEDNEVIQGLEFDIDEKANEIERLEYDIKDLETDLQRYIQFKRKYKELLQVVEKIVSALEDIK